MAKPSMIVDVVKDTPLDLVEGRGTPDGDVAVVMRAPGASS
ncbi:hypothetical protein SSCG_01799 [Streptomyces clavuligerus]|nr:hypothetical protein SSCG_01799 [Streptomyces clavuligerus]